MQLLKIKKKITTVFVDVVGVGGEVRFLKIKKEDKKGFCRCW